MKLHQSLRILLKYRLYTSFALIGLSVAITSTWFIADYVTASYSYDAFHQRAANIYRLTMEISAGGESDQYATTGIPLGEFMKENFPGIEEQATLQLMPSIVHFDDDVFQESAFYSANVGTLNTFSFDFLSGGESALAKPNSIIISQSLAEKYFDKNNAIGQYIQVNETIYSVTGVFRDWPSNSHININALVSRTQQNSYEPQNWFDIENYTYVLLRKGTNQEELADNLSQVFTEHLGPLIEGSGLSVNFLSQPLQKVFFSPALVDDLPKGNLVYTYSLALAGILILLIAGLNFINLNLTRSTQRSKEIVLKKILGISRKQLRLQSGLESAIMSLLALTLSSILILVFAQSYQGYTGFNALVLADKWPMLLAISLLVFIFGQLGSSYSGIYLSFSSQSLNHEGPRINLFKKALLSFQYGITAVVIILTLVMEQQLDFIENKDLGFEKQEVLILSLPQTDDSSAKGLQIRDHLKNTPSIQNASLIGGGALPGEENGKDLFEVVDAGVSQEKVYNIYRVDEHYFNVLDIAFASGRNFSAELVSDKANSVIINEALAQSLNWDEALGQEIWYGGEKREVIGVIKNFHNKSLHNLIEPIVFIYESAYSRSLLVKASTSTIPIVEASWKEFFPNAPFTLTHFDQLIGNMYSREDQLMLLFRFFSVVALILCGMGLFAIFSLHVQQRIKEMSIRKVLGANYRNLLKVIISNYGWVLISAITLATPLAWWMIKNWLGEFSYHLSVGIDVFLLSGCILFVTSLLAIAFHLNKVANLNPVDGLKND